MIKATQAFLTGLFFAFILDFTLFLGIKLHYIDRHGIDVYYNTLFADYQNPFVFFPIVLAIGWVTIYLRSTPLKLALMGMLFAAAFSTLVPMVGERCGEWMLRHNGIEIVIPPHTYRGDIVYTDRQKLYFYDTDLQRIITLPKEK